MEVVEMLSKKVPEIIEAFEVLKVVSSDVETGRDAEIRFKSMSDKASNLAGARYRDDLEVRPVDTKHVCRECVVCCKEPRTCKHL